MKKYFRVSRRRNPARKPLKGLRDELTPNELARFKLLKKLSGPQLTRLLPAWARPKTMARETFTPGRPPKYPSWTGKQVMAPQEFKFPDPRREWSTAKYIAEFNRLNGPFKKNPSKRDYIKVAGILKHARAELAARRLSGPAMQEFIAHELADWFQDDNPKFQRARFFQAAGMLADTVKKNPRRKSRRAINPRHAKYEIQANKRWIPVTSHIFRSWAGNRRKNGKPYRGPRFYLGTNTLYKK